MIIINNIINFHLFLPPGGQTTLGVLDIKKLFADWGTCLHRHMSTQTVIFHEINEAHVYTDSNFSYILRWNILKGQSYSGSAYPQGVVEPCMEKYLFIKVRSSTGNEIQSYSELGIWKFVLR